MRVISKAAYRLAIKYYVQQFRNHWGWTIITLLTPAIGSIFVFYAPTLIVAEVIDKFVAEGVISLSSASIYLLLFAGSWILGETLWRIGLHYAIKLEVAGIENLAGIGFGELMKRDYNFYSSSFVGSLTKKGLAFARNFEAITDTLLFNVFSNIIPLIFAMVVLARYSWILPIALIILLGIGIAVALPIIRRRAKLVEIRHDAQSKMSGRLSDSITNALAIKSFAHEDRELKHYKQYVNDFAVKAKKSWDYQNLRFDTVIAPIYVLSNTVGLILAIYIAGRYSLEAGTIFVIFNYFAQGTRVFWEITRVYRNIESNISEAAEFTQLFVNDPMVQDMPGAKKLKVSNAEITFDNTYFKYPDNPDEVAVDLSLSIKPNEKVGLVGHSGSGKTTISKLLLRFLDVTEGKILIDGQDIKEVTQKSLRDTISYVPQEPLLFHRSLFENIAYAKPNATRRQVLKASKIAHADEFIKTLPDGYDTLVGERGVKLSGGQRQRVAIARAILKDAPILVLDEATSSLDSESEKLIQSGLAKLMKNKTAVVIAHRLSTIKHLDRIIVLEDGKIREQGTHEELLKKKGVYASLWKHQTGFLSD